MNIKISEELAEIAGLFAADGSLQKKYLCIWGNIIEDKNYYDTHISRLFLKIFKKLIKVHAKPSNSVYGFYLCDKSIVEYFNRILGFPIGKKMYSVRIPKIILNSSNKKIKSAFLRGFADGDGCLTFQKRVGTYTLFNRTYHVYPRIFLSSVSFNLIQDIKRILDELNIPSAFRTRRAKKAKMDCAELVLRGKNRLNQWMKLVGFSNPVSITKYEIWKKFGFCPPNTNLKQRTQILKGNLNPFLYYVKKQKPF